MVLCVRRTKSRTMPAIRSMNPKTMRDTENASMEMAVASGVPEPMTKAPARSIGTTIRRARTMSAMGNMVRRTQPSYEGVGLRSAAVAQAL